MTPTKVEPFSPSEFQELKKQVEGMTPGDWLRHRARTFLHIGNGTTPVVSISISPPRIPEKDLRDIAVRRAEANAQAIAATPRLLATVDALMEGYEEIECLPCRGSGEIITGLESVPVMVCRQCNGTGNLYRRKVATNEVEG